MSASPAFRLACALAAALALAAFAAAQQPLVPVPAAPAAAVAVPPSYRIGPGDVLAMSVFGAPELADSAMRVDTDGTIHTPYGVTPVRVAGLTLGAASRAVATELVKDNLAVDPRVELQVVDVESHPITISGAGVRMPGVIQAVQPIRLLDVLTRSGGLSDNGGEVTVISTQPGGHRAIQTYQAAQVLAANDDAANPWLRGGEEVLVTPGGNAYLSGAVVTPGAYPLSDSDPLTVRKVLAKAHGLTSVAKAGQAQLIHHVGEPDQTTHIINLGAILEGKAPDIPLAANDMVYVPVSGGKRAAIEAVSHTLTALTLAAATLMVQ